MEREKRTQLSRAQRGLAAVVVAGAVVIAAIGFAGSYAAVRELALRKGFGAFAIVFPIGVDAGIAVLLSLDLLLTWMRIPFPMLRQTAWLLTAATIAFNAAAAWPDPVGVGMHGVIPILFVVAVEAARHAVGRLAAITADQYMEGVRLWRWVLAPLPTFRLWRRMMLWEIRRYEDGLNAERQRLVYQAHLRSRHGRGWRWKAPVEDLLPLRIARYGVPLEVASRPRSRESDEDLRGAYPVGRLDADERHQEPAPTSRPVTGPVDMRGAQSGESLGTHRAAAPHAERAAGTTEREQARSATEGDMDPREPVDVPREDEELSAAGSDQVTEGLTAEPHVPGLDRPALGSSDVNESRKNDEAPSDFDGGGEQTGDTHPEADPTEELNEKDRPATEGGHREAVAALKSNAAAVRYAMKVLGSTHTPAVVDWLMEQGRVVNRGQAHKITKEAEERRRLKLVKDAS